MGKRKQLTQKQIKEIQKKLLSEREKLTMKDKSKENFCLDKNELSDVLDEANINIQTSQELRFRNREIFYLKKINKTLEMIDNDTYGFCKECEEEIGFERLSARPTAELCITCKEESEMMENNNIHLKKSKSLGVSLADMARR